MLSWSTEENMLDDRTTKKKQLLTKIGLISFVLVACLLAVQWQSSSQNASHDPTSSVGTMNHLVRSDESLDNMVVRADVDGLPPVLTKGGSPVRVAGSCVKTNPNNTNEHTAHVTVHLNGQNEHLNVTDESLTEKERRMLNSIHKSAHPDEFVEAARLEFTHAVTGRKKSMVIHVRKDTKPEVEKVPIETENPYANKTVTPSLLRKVVRDSKLSFTQEDSTVPLADVLAGCELLMEGRRKFSLKQERKVKGKEYSEYVEVEMVVMTGCEAANDPIYGEFIETESKIARSVTCASREVQECLVETIDSTATVEKALNEYKKKHGDGPVDTETMQKVLADLVPEHVGKLGVQVAPDCFGHGYNFFLCLVAVIVAIPLALIVIIVVLTSESADPEALVAVGKWWFSGLISANSGGGGGGCLPRGIGILLMTGQSVDVEHLSVGNAVWSLGSGEKNLIYMQGHRDAGAVSEFVWIKTASGRQVGASRGHFGIVFDDMSENAACHEWKSNRNTSWTWEMFDLCHVHKRFDEFLDWQEKKWSVFVKGSGDTNGSATVWLEEVTGAEVRTGLGLYNPYSMDGTLIANGVMVSAHSEFILDSLVPARYDHVLPKVYQLMFSPLRAMYRVCPRCAKETDRLLERGAGEHSALEVLRAIWLTFVQPQLRS